jgi:hypothetical protein
MHDYATNVRGFPGIILVPLITSPRLLRAIAALNRRWDAN